MVLSYDTKRKCSSQLIGHKARKLLKKAITRGGNTDLLQVERIFPSENDLMIIDNKMRVSNAFALIKVKRLTEHTP